MGTGNIEAIKNMPLGQLELVAQALGINDLMLSIQRSTASTYEQFIDILYRDIDEIIFHIQENPELRKNDKEDRLSIEIIGMLKSRGYDASHEAKFGGHCDILVRGRNNFTWIGEAKIHSSYDYLFQGFQQLCTRYSTGDIGQDQGGLIIYIRNNDSASVISKWKDSLGQKELEELKFIECQQRPNFVFYTTHKHDRSGCIFKVKHIGVILGFDPKDKAEAA